MQSPILDTIHLVSCPSMALNDMNDAWLVYVEMESRMITPMHGGYF